MTDLIERIERAGEDEQRALLEEAFEAVFGKSPTWLRFYGDIEQKHEARSFDAKLNAEAYVDAALMLVPDEMRDEMEIITLYCIARATINMNHGPDGCPFYGENHCNIVSMAIASAALKAKDTP